MLEEKSVTVSAGFFEKEKDDIISTQTIGSYDIQMMVRSFPSVVIAIDQNNEILMRVGGLVKTSLLWITWISQTPIVLERWLPMAVQLTY